MHLYNAFYMLAMAAFAQEILGKPTGLSKRSTAMTSADIFSPSEDNWDTWVQQKVDQGKMFYPENRVVQLQASNKTESLENAFNIKDIACEVVSGTARDYDEGKRRFCNLVRLYAQVTTEAIIYILQEGLCDEDFNTFACDLWIGIVSGASVAFQDNAIPDMCEAMFEAIWDDCGGRAGVARIATRTDPEINVAGFSTVFYIHDDTSTCPAHPPDDICRIEDF